MQKSSLLLAVLFAVGAATLAHADSTGVNFNYNGGTLSATETVKNGQVTSISIDGYNLNLFSGASNSLLEGCEKSGCSWDLFDVSGSVILEVSYNGLTEYAGCVWCTNGYGQIKGGSTYGPNSAVPEPPVYLLALLGIFFMPNRISQGLRQTLRLNR